jgi:tetratricopeptide (TPR) repeat protein
MNRKLLTLLIVPILLASTTAALPIQYGYGQVTLMEDEQLTAKLLDFFDEAKRTLDGIFARLEASGVPIPGEAIDNYGRGLAIAGDAVELKAAGRFAEAKEKVLEAMQHLRDAILAVAEDLEEVETPEERDAREAAAILGAVDRIEDTITRLEDIAANAEALGIDASGITDRLELVQGLLLEIKGHIEDGDISEAARDMEMSQRDFGEAMAGLKPITDAIKVNQAGRFLDMAEGRLLSISDMVTSVIAALPPTVPDKVKEMIEERVGQGIQTAQAKIDEARSLLQEGRVNEAMPILGELRADIANVMAEVEQQIPGIGVALENIDRREAVLEVLEDTAEILSGKGVDATDLLAKIQEARGLVQDAVESLKEGNLEAVNARLAQVDGIIDEAKNLVDQLVAQG